MRLVKNTIEGDIIGKPLLTFSSGLTKKARNEIGTKIEYMDRMFELVEQAVSDGHIKVVLENLTKLQAAYTEYKETVYSRNRKLNVR